MTDNKLKGRRCYVLKRCSTKGQADTSLRNQDASLDQLLIDNEIIKAGEKELPGVTGSVPGARADIDQILKLKRSGADFDLLLLPNTDRFTRAGQLHANKILWDLEGAGISVYFAAERLWSDDRLHRTILSFLFDAAQQTAIAISRGATAGATNSYLDCRSPNARRTSFGLDRAYSVDGKTLFILRNLPDGTQRMLDPQSGEVMRTFGRNPQKGTPAHYIKQKNESVRLVSGDPVQVAVVQMIHQAIHVEGRSRHSVAKELTDAGIFSPCGNEWDGKVVGLIAFNPVYVGILIRGRQTSALYYKSARGAPVEATVDIRELREQPRLSVRQRPYEEWLIREDDGLREFLPEPLRSISRAAIELDLRNQAASRPKRPKSKDRHRGSAFILKNILRSAPGDYPMTGRVGGRNGDYRRYGVAKGRKKPKTNDELRTTLAADPLEVAVLGVVREVLLATPELEKVVRDAAAELNREEAAASDRERLGKELRRRQRQLAVALESITGDAEADGPIVEKIKEFRSEIARVAADLRQRPQPKEPMDAAAVAQRVLAELQTFGQNLDAEDSETVHEMLKLLISRMTADLQTRAVEFDLSLPAWAMERCQALEAMSLVRRTAWNTSNEAHQRIALASYRCEQLYEQRQPCYRCRRVRNAA